MGVPMSFVHPRGLHLGHRRSEEGWLMTFVDLKPATRRMTALIRGIPDERLGGLTPCPAYTLGDLVDHVGGLTLAFTAAARNDTADIGSQGPLGDASRLSEDWRRDLAALAEAWRDPAAWQGTTRAGPSQSGPAARYSRPYPADLKHSSRVGTIPHHRGLATRRPRHDDQRDHHQSPTHAQVTTG
jgi:hypothetical protein